MFTAIFTVPISLALSALALCTPPAILRALSQSRSPGIVAFAQPEKFPMVAQIILGLLLVQLLLDLTDNVIAAKIQSSENRVLAHLGHIWTKYVRERDWYHDYNPEVRKAEERVQQGTQSNHGAGVHFPMDFANMLTQVLNILLFGAVVSLLHPVILFLLVLGCGLNALMGKWERRKNWEERDIRNDLEKKINCTKPLTRRQVLKIVSPKSSKK